MRFLTKTQVSKLVGLSHSTIDRMEKEGDFPKRRAYNRPNRKGNPYWSRVYWLDEDVHNWQLAQPGRTTRDGSREGVDESKVVRPEF